MTSNNPSLENVNINADKKSGEILFICSQDIEKNEIMTSSKGHNSVTMSKKNTGNNPNADLVNIYPYIKFGEILSIFSQDIERKRNSGISQRQLCEKNDA